MTMDETEKECETCGGTGYDYDPDIGPDVECPVCFGNGFVDKEPETAAT